MLDMLKHRHILGSQLETDTWEQPSQLLVVSERTFIRSPSQALNGMSFAD